MATELRKTGIGIVGDIAWDTHFCCFYETTQDLLDILVPYFKAGVEHNEFCLWVISVPLTEEEARSALRRAVPDLDRYLAERRIEILPHDEWYLKEGAFDLHRVIDGWKEKLAQALAPGYAGMRVSGNTAWLQKKDWRDFREYEKELDVLIANQRMIVLCTYPLAASGAAEILDVARIHQVAVARRQGNWEIVETPELMQAKQEIQRLNEELEQRVIERTSELAATNEALRREISEHKQVEALLHTREQEFRAFVENAPDQIIRYDKEFRRAYVNPAVIAAYGLPKEAFIGKSIGSIVEDARVKTDIDEISAVRRQIKSVFDTGEPTEYEVTWPLPGGRSTFWARLFPEFDSNGMVINVLGIARDITERKRSEEALRASEARLQAAIDAADIGLWDWDLVSGQIIWLGHHEKLFGFAPGEFDGTYPGFEKCVHPEDLEELNRAVQRARDEGSDYAHEYRVIWPDGSIHWIAGRGRFVYNETGQPVRMCGAVIDITERKQAEAAIRSLLHISEKLHATLDIDALLDSLVIEAMKLIDAEIGWSGLRSSEGMVCHTHIAPDLQVVPFEYVWPPGVGLPGWVLVHKVPYVMHDAQSDTVIIPEIRERFGVNAAIDTPILDAQGEVIGFFEVNNKKNGGRFAESDVEKLVAVSRIASIALQHALSYGNLERAEKALRESQLHLQLLSRQLLQAQEVERRAIARELHDEIGQLITGLSLMLTSSRPLPLDRLAQAQALVRDLMEQVRNLALDLRPTILDDLGLLPALVWLFERYTAQTNVSVRFEHRLLEDQRFDPDVETAAYRIIQEALTNVARHAGVREVTMRLWTDADTLWVVVADQGRGFDPQTIDPRASSGLTGMRERAALLSGSLTIEAGSGRGTRLTATLPLHSSAGAWEQEHDT